MNLGTLFAGLFGTALGALGVVLGTALTAVVGLGGVLGTLLSGISI